MKKQRDIERVVPILYIVATMLGLATLEKLLGQKDSTKVTLVTRLTDKSLDCMVIGILGSSSIAFLY
jgi:hypothetical protein